MYPYAFSFRIYESIYSPWDRVLNSQIWDLCLKNVVACIVYHLNQKFMRNPIMLLGGISSLDNFFRIFKFHPLDEILVIFKIGIYY